MNQKRAAIENFIEKDLLDAVTKEVSLGALAHESDLADHGLRCTVKFASLWSVIDRSSCNKIFTLP